MSRFVRLLAGVLLAGSAAFAQDSATTSPAAPAPGHDQVRRDSAEKKLKRLSKRLNLTDEQKEKARPILQDEQKQVTALDSDSTLSTQQKHKKMRGIRTSSRSQLDAILTPEQKEKISSGRGGGGGHHHQHPDQTTTPSTDANTPQ